MKHKPDQAFGHWEVFCFFLAESGSGRTRRRQRVALLTDVAGSAHPARVSQWIKRRNATPVQCDFDRAVGERPRTSLRSPGAADQHHRRRGDHTIIIGIRPERPSSIVRPQPESCPWGSLFGTCLWVGTHCRHRRRQQVAPCLQRGARLCLARARGKCAPLSFTPLPSSEAARSSYSCVPTPCQLSR